MKTNIKDADVQALIVGAGPTGLTLACELARHGVTFRIIDKAPGISERSKGLLLHARTLEIFESLGIAREVITRGLKVHDANIYAEGNRLVRINFDELDSGFPYAISLPQKETVSILLDLLKRFGAKVEYSVTLEQFEMDDDVVHAVLRHADGHQEMVHAKWLLGCDGLNSVVRNSLGLPFEGQEDESGFVLADARVNWNLAADEMHTFVADDGLATLIPMPNGLVRIILSQTELNPGASTDTPSLAEMQNLLRHRTNKDIFLRETLWTGRYYVHHRIAPRYRIGRTFLLGDAAHLQNPADGQSLNFGIHDAYNLGWKIGLVERGRAGELILESYHQERHSVAKNLLSVSDRLARVASWRHPVAQAIRNRVAKFMSNFEVIQDRLNRHTAMIGLNYRNSAVVSEDRTRLLDAHLAEDESDEEPSVEKWQDFGFGPQPGDRAPDGRINVHHGPKGIPLYELMLGTKHNLLLFDGCARTPEGYLNLRMIAKQVEDNYGDLIRVHVVVASEHLPFLWKWGGSVILDSESQLHYRYGAGSECMYLIRPDGHIGYRCQPARWEKLDAYLREVYAPTKEFVEHEHLLMS